MNEIEYQQLNMLKRAMLENINSLSKDRLQCELRFALEDKWKLQDEVERLNNIINKAIGLIYDYQMNDEENENYKELLYVLKGDDK